LTYFYFVICFVDDSKHQYNRERAFAIIDDAILRLLFRARERERWKNRQNIQVYDG